MDHVLLTLLQNNDAPSDETITQIKSLLVQPLNEEVPARAEVQELETRLQESRRRLEGIQATIACYNTVLAPIRRLPPDILGEIFYRCLPVHRNSIMSASDAPMLFTRICSTWRSVALSSPRIWTRLHIPLPGSVFIMAQDPSGHLVRPNDPGQYFSQVRLEALREWLSRSGTCPLSISVSQLDYGHTLDQSDDDVFSQIFQTIVQYAHRWREIELTMPRTVYKKLESKLSVDMISSIRSVRADLRDRSRIGGSHSPDHSPHIFLQSPNLIKLSFSSNTWKPNSWERDVPRSTWNRLTYLSLHCSIPDVEVFGLLSQCYNLIDCKLTIGSSWNNLQEDAEDPRLQHFQDATIDLAHLRSLAVADAGTIPIVTKLFQSINIPSLIYIDYRTLRSGPGYYDIEDNSTGQEDFPLPLFALLERTSVTKLALNTRGISALETGTCIKMGNSIRHLILGEEMFDPEPRQTPMYIYDDCNWDLNCLAIDRSRNIPTTGLLLPELEILEAYGLFTFTDGGLLNLITTRIDAWKSGTAAKLKMVKIQFQREKQLDIIAQASEYAKAAGLDLILDLQYTTKRMKYLDPASSSYGLTFDGRTWGHSDIEESILPT